MVETRELRRRFGERVAVDGVSLSVERGVVGFLGPNGAGKTTTMRMVVGVLPPSSGTARVCGHDVVAEPLAVKAKVGWLPETPPLHRELTVGEHLAFAAELRRLPEPRRAAGRALEEVGLTGAERRVVDTLSKGFRQRLGLALALIHEPPLLVLDEPTAGLDPAQVQAFRALLAALARDRVVLLSTHVLSEVEACCDRVILVAKGRVVGDGTVAALAEQAGQGPRLELEVDGEGDLRAALAAVPGALGVERTGPRTYRLRGEGLEAAVSDVVTGARLRVLGLARRGPSLERVFLALTGDGP